MKTQSTFTNAGWDFNTVWKMNPRTGYPMLQWEENIKPFEEKTIEAEITDIEADRAKINANLTPREDNVKYKYYVTKKSDSSLAYVSSEMEDGVNDNITNLEPETEYIVKIRAYFDNGNNYTDITKEITTAIHVYEISTINDLEDINSDLAGSYKLTRSLDFSDPNCYENGENDERYIYFRDKRSPWFRLSGSGTQGTFRGTFDGNHKQIKGFRWNTSNYAFEFMFHIGSTGVVKDLKLHIDSVNTSWGYIPICDGNWGLIENVAVIADYVSAGTYKGGLVYENYGTIRNSYSIVIDGNGSGTITDRGNGVVESCYGISVSKNLGKINGNGYANRVPLEEMDEESDYEGFDFSTVWEMNPETGYPRLQWEKNIKQ